VAKPEPSTNVDLKEKEMRTANDQALRVIDAVWDLMRIDVQTILDRIPDVGLPLTSHQVLEAVETISAEDSLFTEPAF
jgi:hypothetical protein